MTATTFIYTNKKFMRHMVTYGIHEGRHGRVVSAAPMCTTLRLSTKVQEAIELMVSNKIKTLEFDGEKIEDMSEEFAK